MKIFRYSLLGVFFIGFGIVALTGGGGVRKLISADVVGVASPDQMRVAGIVIIGLGVYILVKLLFAK